MKTPTPAKYGRNPAGGRQRRSSTRLGTFLSPDVRREQQVVASQLQHRAMEKRRNARSARRAEREREAAHVQAEIAGRQIANEYAESGEFDVEAARRRYGAMSIKGLRAEAKGVKLPSYSRMTKPELVEALATR